MKPEQAEWQAPDGTRWQGFYFTWSPGRVAAYLAKRHTPEICLTSSGRKLRSGPKLLALRINGVDLPMRQYVFETDRGLLHVFHCRWEPGTTIDDYVAREPGRYSYLRGIWAGRGNRGQKVLEFIATGFQDATPGKRGSRAPTGDTHQGRKSGTHHSKMTGPRPFVPVSGHPSARFNVVL